MAYEPATRARQLAGSNPGMTANPSATLQALLKKKQDVDTMLREQLKNEFPVDRVVTLEDEILNNAVRCKILRYSTLKGANLPPVPSIIARNLTTGKEREFSPFTSFVFLEPLV